MPEETGDTLPFTVLNDVVLGVGDPTVKFKSGCSILDLALSQNEPLVYLEFDNYYASRISLRMKGVFEENGKEVWKTVLKDFILMPDPYSEIGSEDSFRINIQKECKEVPENLLGLRIIIQQPSPHWQNFAIKNVKLRPQSSDVRTEEKFVTCTSVAKARDEEELLSYGLVLNSVTSKLRQIAMMRTKVATVSETRDDSRDFEVDGSYEVNLLSYT